MELQGSTDCCRVSAFNGIAAVRGTGMKLHDADEPLQRYGEDWNVYTATLQSESSANWARASAIEMMHLLARLDEIADDRTWYASTSHHTLVLRLCPSHDGMILISISPSANGRALARANGLPEHEAGCYGIRYRIPDSESVWPNASVEMSAQSVSECLAALRVALKHCG